MEMGEKIAALRRREGLSQEQLADRLGVSRQSVSKWESGAAAPELVKVIALSDLFGVTVDALVREGDLEISASDAALARQVRELAREVQESSGSLWSYTSTRRLFGLPLVCIRMGHARQPNRHNTAVGVLAIGNYAVGVVSLGLLSAGGFSLGLVSFGLMALGMVSVGGLAVGISALGLVSVGISALGVLRAAGLAAEAMR